MIPGLVHRYGRALLRRSSALAVTLALATALAACDGSFSGGPIATVRPTPSPGPSTATPTATDTATPVASPSAVATETPSRTSIPTATPSPVPTPVPSPVGVIGLLAWQSVPQNAAPAPPAREDHTWTSDGAGEYAYLFGGRSGNTVYDDIWRFDLAEAQWQILAPDGAAPAARFGHTATWVDGLGLVMWSGQSGSSFFGDLWLYDPDSDRWEELPAAGDVPDARYGSCAAVGPDGRLFISHGFTDTGRFFDTRAYDFTTRSWEDVTPAEGQPVERCLHDCLWTQDGRFLLYAGQTTGVAALRDLWSLTGLDATPTWAQQAEPEPAARQLYALAVVGPRAFIFGGGALDGAKLGDLWQLDLGPLAWDRLDPPGSAAPSARSGATLLSDAIGERLLLFGGRTAQGALSDLWQLPFE